MIDDRALLRLTTDIVIHYVRAQFVPHRGLPDLIRNVHAALDGLVAPSVAAPRAQKRSMAQVRACIRPRGVVSLQDRRTFQLLRPRQVGP